ncbi:MAG TPA: peptidoglycan DD-metalloendopeptidase family protein [Candidatus Limnocylindrales bacterium]|nr:peptidoglycan DD-metalloendopeptidase family protein [Candidatus Limnocylindrales bacterium]
MRFALDVPRSRRHARPAQALNRTGHRPAVAVIGLIAVSLAGLVATAWPADATPRSEIRIVPDGAFSDVPVALTPSETPVGALGPAPPPPVALEPTPTPLAPTVVRFRPRHGWTDVATGAQLSVRFNLAMDHASTEAAFRAMVGGTRIDGSVRWAEGDTVLVLRPARALPYGAVVHLVVDAGARSRSGAVLRSASSVTFAVAPRPAPQATPRPAPQATPKPRSTAWRWPLIGPITQKFGESLTQYGFHQGIDINGETGDAVRAARGGTVTVAGHWDECGGLQVHIDHGGGVESWYRHFSRVSVRVGQRVDAGTVVGAVGETGCAFGSHLHFAIRANRSFVDPLRYLPPR